MATKNEHNDLALKIGQIIAADMTVKFMPGTNGNIIIMVTHENKVRFEDVQISECARNLKSAFEQIIIELLS